MLTPYKKLFIPTGQIRAIIYYNLKKKRASPVMCSYNLIITADHGFFSYRDLLFNQIGAASTTYQ